VTGNAGTLACNAGSSRVVAPGINELEFIPSAVTVLADALQARVPALAAYSKPTKLIFDKLPDKVTTRLVNRYRLDETLTVYDWPVGRLSME